MTYLKQILTELREKRLWPVAVVLIVALVAVPTLLAKSASQTPTAALPQSTPSAASPATAVPAVTVQTTTDHSSLKGRGRDPFRQQKLPVAPTPASTATTSPNKSSTGSAAGSTGSGSSAASGGKSGASGGSTTGGSTTVTPLPRVLFYRFATSLRFGRQGSRLRSIKDVNKFTPLPSANNPVVLFLGLRNDAKTAVFLLSSSASATGAGTCLPNHWTCNFLDLKVGQRELLLTQGALGHIAQYELDLTRIHPVPTSAPSSANAAASAHVSRAGRRIFERTAEFLPALRSIIYSTKTGLLTFTHRSAVRLVHVGRLASAPATAVRASAGGGAQ